MEYLILLGGNIGTANQTLNVFEEFWNQYNFGKWQAISSIHQSKAWGVKHPEQHPIYWNQARILVSNLSIHELLMIGQLAQKQFAQQKLFQYDDREFDFDLIQVNQVEFSDNQVSIPHPKTLERKFALDCIVEIAKDWIYPGQPHNYEYLWKNFPEE